MAPATSTTERRTQEERSAATRARLLDATVECLIEFGYAGTTTTVISERAGVSRGAQLHHYPTKAALVAATVEHLAVKIGERVAQQARDLSARSGSSRAEGAIDLLWTAFDSHLFEAWLELWVAGRTDDDLRRHLRPVEHTLAEGVRLHSRAVFGLDGGPEGYGEVIEQTVMFLQGLALNRAMASDPPEWKRREAALVDGWKRTVRARLDAGA